MPGNEVLMLCCDVSGCPYSHEKHGHMPTSTREWKPKSNLKISDSAAEIAKVILHSYDGLTPDQRHREELRQEFIKELASYIQTQRIFSEHIKDLGELVLTGDVREL